MHYRQLGKWGVRVSEISLGSWLTAGTSVDEKASSDLLHYAFEKGVNFFDTANVYGHGAAELVWGKAIQSLHRDSLFLATKVFFPMGKGPNDKGLSRKHIFSECHASLKRLNTDYIDLYQTHRFDPETPLLELVRAMDDLVRQGKILYWGVSEWPSEKIDQVVNLAHEINAHPPVSNQPLYNMLHRNIEEAVIPVSWQHGMGQVCFSPLAQGVLTGKYKPGHPIPADSRGAHSQNNAFMLGRDLLSEDNLKKVAKLSALAQEHGITTAQLALAWCLRLKEVSSVIVGATKRAQLDDNLAASSVKLEEPILRAIEEILGNKPVLAL